MNTSPSPERGPSGPSLKAVLVDHGPPARREQLEAKLTLIEIASEEGTGGVEDFLAIEHEDQVLAVPATATRQALAHRRIVAAASTRFRTGDDRILHAEDTVSLKLEPSRIAGAAQGFVLRLADGQQALELPARAIGPVLRQAPQVALVGAPSTATLH